MSIWGCSEAAAVGAEEELEELEAVSMAAEQGLVIGRFTRLFLLQPPPTGTFLRVPPLVQ